MSLTEFWSWLEVQPLSEYIGGTAWFPFLESLHVVAVTFVVAGPSANKHRKLPAPDTASKASEPATFCPSAPHPVVTVWMSTPGSDTMKL